MKATPFSKEPVLGVDLAAHAVKVVEARFSRGRLQVLRAVCREINYADPAASPEEKRDFYAAELAKLLAESGIKTRRAVISIPACDADVRIIDFGDSGGPEDMPFEMQETEIYTQPLELPGKGAAEQGKVLIVTGRRNAVVESFNIARAAGLDPVAADVDVFAVLNAYMLEAAPAGEGLTVLLDMGADTTNIAIVEKGMVKVVRTVFIAGKTFTRTLQNRLGVSQEEAEALKKRYGLSRKCVKSADGAVDPAAGTEEGTAEAVYGLLSSQMQQITTEISRTIAYLSEKTAGAAGTIVGLTLTGDSAEMPGLPEYLKAELGSPAEIFRPFRKLGQPRFADKSCSNHPGFAAAAGLSLRLPGFEERLLARVNLLPKGLAKRSNTGLRVAVYCLVLGLLAAGYYSYSRFEEAIRGGLSKAGVEASIRKIELKKIRDRDLALREAKTRRRPSEVRSPRRHAFVMDLTISGVFTDSSGGVAFLSGPEDSYVVKSGKMYYENGEAVAGIAAVITPESIVLSEGEERYELKISQ